MLTEEKLLKLIEKVRAGEYDKDFTISPWICGDYYQLTFDWNHPNPKIVNNEIVYAKYKFARIVVKKKDDMYILEVCDHKAIISEKSYNLFKDLLKEIKEKNDSKFLKETEELLGL